MLSLTAAAEREGLEEEGAMQVWELVLTLCMGGEQRVNSGDE